MSVTGTSKPDRARLSGEHRLSAAILGLALIVPLVVARGLEPDPRNRGTHRQLGLPPCTVVVLFGRPCPACGMTTACAHLVRGHWTNALRANAGGALLGILDLVAVPWLLLSAACGRWLGRVPTSTAMAWAAVLVMLVTLIDWGLRLMTG